MQNYKLVLIGDGNTGKTAFITHFICGEYKGTYVPTLGVDVHPIIFDGIKFYVWDTAGQDKFRGLREGYYIQADAAIVFYTKNSDHIKTDEELKKFRRMNPNAKIVIVWGKCDAVTEASYFETISSLPNYLKRYTDFPVYQISGKSLYDYEKPFLVLKQQLQSAGN